MSEFKGTKTGWELLKETSLLGVQIGKTIFRIYNINEVTKANALLISKAPEMLEMIQSLIEAKNNGNDWDSEELFIKAEVLIKEATEL